jgi:hypothetical protein
MPRKKKDEDEEAVGGRETGGARGRWPRFKGGRKSKRDKRFGISDPWFWRWWHRVKKPQLGGLDGDGDKIRAAYDEWVSKNRPRVN